MDSSEWDDEKERPPIVVAVLYHGPCRLGTAVDSAGAMTLWTTMSEDPATWDEVAGYWARYRFPAVCKFLDGLPIGPRDHEQAIGAIEGHDNWLAIDLVQKRTLPVPMFNHSDVRRHWRS